ncbi:MAG: shikimate dehydrogenase [Clostridia bacterium]|nr:shikimate dehydrogenase [Clostridia bacterium]
MNKLCVIGDPVLHSKSPLIQNAMIKELGIPYVYTAMPVPSGELAAWLERAKAEGYAGFNATMPHKEALIPHIDVLSQEAAASASVNTVCIKGGKLYGYSTDGTGFLQALADAGVVPTGKRVLLLGAGGVAKAVSLGLLSAGVQSAAVCNRTLSKAEKLCAARPELLHPADFSPETLRREAEAADLLVNCTSLGMAGTNGQFDDFSFLDALPPHAAVCDLIYNPAETALLTQSRLRGHFTLNGLGMLIHQAICALEHFTGMQLDAERMRQAVKRALQP